MLGLWPFKVADKILAMTQFANCIFFSRPENGTAEDPGIVVGLSLGLRLGLQKKKTAKKKLKKTSKTTTILMTRIVEEIVRIENPNNPGSEPSLPSRRHFGSSSAILATR